MRWLLVLLMAMAMNAFADEIFTEELLLRPLPNAKVLSHFHFSSELPPIDTYGKHHRIFPKAIFQLVSKFRIREMELSFTQGRWDYRRWGALDPVAQIAAKPVGVQLSASLDVPANELDSTWGNLTNALSGLFCASLNFLESPTSYVDPWFALAPGPQSNGTHTNATRLLTERQSSNDRGMRYGVLPREAVCTENLTPWLKLLPCRDKAGLTQLFDRPTIYGAFYHSLRLAIKSGPDTGTILEQSLTLVIRPQGTTTDLSVSSVFGVGQPGVCPLAKLSKVYLDTETEVEITDSLEASSSLLVYPVDGASPLGLGNSGKWSPASAQGPFSVTRFLTGSGNARGSIAILLGEYHDTSLHCDDLSSTDITIRQMVPWYVRLYGHTLQVSVDGQTLKLWDAVSLMRFTPGEDRKSPSSLEISLRLPANVHTVAVSIEYDKGFLHIDEHPPDANRGFDLPSALISFPSCRVHGRYVNDKSPLLEVLQREYPLKVYSEALLMPLATPDFSMPYNVIAFTCSILTFYFSLILTTLRTRIGEEERLAKEGAGTGVFKAWSPKLFKVAVVVVLGVAFIYFSN